jgi:hypothetical protein
MKESINQAKKEITTLQASIELVQARREELSKEISDKRQEINDIKSERMKVFLGPAVENLQCDTDGGYFGFDRIDERSGLSGLFTIRSEFRYGGELIKELSYYTTTCDNDAEFERLEIIGKVAHMLRTATAEQLYDYVNEGLEAKKLKLSELRENRYSLDKAMRQMEKEISQHEDDITLLQLREGINVGRNDCAWLNVGRKIETSNVFKIKITEESISGKTATVEVTNLIYGYKGDENPWTRKFTRVKVDQLIKGTQNFLNQSKKNKERRQAEKELADSAS